MMEGHVRCFEWLRFRPLRVQVSTEERPNVDQESRRQMIFEISKSKRPGRFQSMRSGETGSGCKSVWFMMCAGLYVIEKAISQKRQRGQEIVFEDHERTRKASDTIGKTLRRNADLIDKPTFVSSLMWADASKPVTVNWVIEGTRETPAFM
jgi:hypothetical protein